MSENYAVKRIEAANTSKKLLLETICNDYPQYTKTGITKVFNKVWEYYSPSEDGQPTDHETYSAIEYARKERDSGVSSNDVVDSFTSMYALKVFKSYLVTQTFLKDFYNNNR